MNDDSMSNAIQDCDRPKLGIPTPTNKCPPADSCCYRETAATMLKMQIMELQKKIKGKEALLKIAEKAENGSELELALWELLSTNENHRY